MEGIPFLIAELQAASERLDETQALFITTRQTVKGGTRKLYSASEALAIALGTSTPPTLMAAYSDIQEALKMTGRIDVDLLSAEIFAQRAVTSLDQYLRQVS